MTEIWYPQINYHFQSCSERARTETIDAQEVQIHELTPNPATYLNFGALLSYCSWLIRRNALLILAASEAEILTDLTPFGFAHGPDFFLFKHFFRDTPVSQYIANLHVERINEPPDIIKLGNCLQALADSIGECIVLPLFLPTLQYVVGWQNITGFLIGPPSLSAYVVAAAGLSLDETPHGRSVDLLANLEVLQYVLPETSTAKQPGKEQAADQGQNDYLFWANLGQCLAILHNARILSDAHLANFIQSSKDKVVKLVDLNPPFTVLLRPVGPHECAANLVALLSSFEGEQWNWFKEGYIRKRGDVGVSVVALAEGHSIPDYEEFLASERYFEAIDPLVEAINSLGPTMPKDNLRKILANLGFCLSQIGEPGAAVQVYERALLFAGDDLDRVTIQFNRAKAYHRNGDINEAIEAFETVRTLIDHPTEDILSVLIETLVCLVLSYDEVDRGGLCIDRANELFHLLEQFRNHGISIHPDTARAIEIAHATRNVHLNPTDVSALLERARTYRRFSSLTMALGDLDRAVDLEPNNIEALLERAAVYHNLEIDDLAEIDLNKAVECALEDETPLLVRAGLYKATGQHEKLIADLSRLIDQHPTDTKWLIARAEAYVAADVTALALADISAAIRLDSQNPQLLLMRGQWLTVMERLQEALADFNRVDDMLSKALSALAEDGGKSYSSGVTDDADDNVDDAERIKRLLGHCHYLRGNALMQADMHEQAVSAFSRAIELVPYRSMYRVGRSLVYQELGWFDEAFEDIDMLIKKGSYSWKHFLRRGVVRRLKGDLEGALSDLFMAKEYWLKMPWSDNMPSVDWRMQHESVPRWELSDWVD